MIGGLTMIKFPSTIPAESSADGAGDWGAVGGTFLTGNGGGAPALLTGGGGRLGAAPAVEGPVSFSSITGSGWEGEAS